MTSGRNSNYSQRRGILCEAISLITNRRLDGQRFGQIVLLHTAMDLGLEKHGGLEGKVWNRLRTSDRTRVKVGAMATSSSRGRLTFKAMAAAMFTLTMSMMPSKSVGSEAKLEWSACSETNPSALEMVSLISIHQPIPPFS